MSRSKKNNDGAGDRSASHFIENMPIENMGEENIPTLEPGDGLTYFATDDSAEEAYARLEAALPPPASHAAESESPPPRAAAASAVVDNNNPGQPTHTAPPPAAPQPATPKTNWGGLILKSAVSGLVMALVGGIFDPDDAF